MRFDDPAILSELADALEAELRAKKSLDKRGGWDEKRPNECASDYALQQRRIDAVREAAEAIICANCGVVAGVLHAGGHPFKPSTAVRNG